MRLAMVQIGKGAVGARLLDLALGQRGALRERLGVDLVPCAVRGRDSEVSAPRGLAAEWRRALRRAESGEPIAGACGFVSRALRDADGPCVFVDATAADGMAAVHAEALAAGGHVVTCNKKPLAGPFTDWQRLKDDARVLGRFYLNEVTVGAGLPVIRTLRDLIDSGDRLRSIEGCFSGTLNFLCTALDRGVTFSTALSEATRLGYTEPDPRDDLDGADVGRKTLILAREAGLALEPIDVAVEPLVPVDRRLAVDAFVDAVSERDAEMTARARAAEAAGRRLRYVAQIGETCRAGLREVPAHSPLGRLAGPDNVFVFRTARYDDRPLVVSGPGAGPDVTAAGAFADIVTIARALAVAH